MKQILVHICCGVCAGSVVERLRDEDFEVVGFFYNPNIHPEEEYKRRLKTTEEVSRGLGFDLIEGSYDKDNWFKLTRGLEAEPEGEKRCEVCFKMRLERAYKRSNELNIPFFTTTLTVSPHKDTSIINRIGRELNHTNFLERDFKKKEGAKLAIEFAKKFDLYRQNYCGCIYSMRRGEQIS